MLFYINNLPSLSNVKTLLTSCFWHNSLLLDALDNHVAGTSFPMVHKIQNMKYH
jgi:hypothetical protein